MHPGAIWPFFTAASATLTASYRSGKLSPVLRPLPVTADRLPCALKKLTEPTPAYSASPGGRKEQPAARRRKRIRQGSARNSHSQFRNAGLPFVWKSTQESHTVHPAPHTAPSGSQARYARTGMTSGNRKHSLLRRNFFRERVAWTDKQKDNL